MKLPKKTARWIMLSMSAVLFSPPATAGQAAPKKVPSRPGWHLLWHDEFDGRYVDRTKWNIEDADLHKNNELQVYAPDDVFLREGALVLQSRKRALSGRKYTSGLVNTRGKFELTQGRVEVRAKFPTGQGIWPAIWMLPADGSWPPEIDIAEVLGHRPDQVHMSLHWGELPDKFVDTDFFDGPDLSKDFHVYALEWEPGEIRWYIDGKQRFATARDMAEMPFYIILNTAVGGDWPGDPDASTRFPQFHRIDYVRVYMPEKKGEYYLTLMADEGKVLVKPRRRTYPKGSRIKLLAKPDLLYKFARWTGDVTGGSNPLRLEMNGHKRITAVFEKDPHGPQLLSEGAITKTSAIEGPNLIGGYATDGEMKTRWSSKFADPQWISIDLGTPLNIEAVRLNWETAYAKAYAIQVSNDARNWRTVYSTEDGQGGADEVSGLKARAQYIRMYGTERATQWGYSLWEFEVYGRR